jgi:hypothetical protein
MPRNISFALTKEQIRNRTKTVTRRLNWLTLKPGDILNACEKCQGIKPGESIVRMGQIRVVSVRRERLDVLLECVNGVGFTEYAQEEMRREGFPGKSPSWFTEFFVKSHKGCELNSTVTRIEFEYV